MLLLPLPATITLHTRASMITLIFMVMPVAAMATAPPLRQLHTVPLASTPRPPTSGSAREARGTSIKLKLVLRMTAIFGKGARGASGTCPGGVGARVEGTSTSCEVSLVNP